MAADNLLDDRIFVLTGNMYQAQIFARNQGIPIKKIYYIQSVERLYGVNGAGKKLYVGGNAHTRDDFQDIVSVAKQRGFEVVQTSII